MRIKTLLPSYIFLRVVVIEQDKSPTVSDLLDKDVVYIFARNDGFYNRGWAFNVGVKEFPESDYYFFADNDIVLKDKDSCRIFTNCFRYEAINPYRKIFDSLPAIHEIHDNDKNYLFETFYRDGIDGIKDIIYSEREGTCFSGGIVGISNSAFHLISGWDERFRGRGWEDYAFTSKINLFLKKTHTYKYTALHIYHPWESNTTREINQVLDIEYSKYRVENYITHILTSEYGDINKYNLSGDKTPDVHYYNFMRKLSKRSKRAVRIYHKIYKKVLKFHDPIDMYRLIYLNLCDQHTCCKCCISEELPDRCESGNMVE